MKGWVAPIILLALCECNQNRLQNKFTDDVLIRISDLQDRRLGDSLYRYFNSSNSQYRSEAAAAFGSIRDTLASPFLGNLLLEDPEPNVRRNAAFALGQTGGFAAVNALVAALTDKNSSVVREALEALGKTIRKNDLEVLKSFMPPDSLAREGLAWSFYRLGVRGLADSVVIVRSTGFLNTANILSTRLAAANFFGRSPLIANHAQGQLANAAHGDPSAEVRMAAVSGLRKFKNDSSLSVLKGVLLRENDYRVRVNLARALQTFEIDKTLPLFLELLKDPSQAVEIAASEAVVNVLKSPSAGILSFARTNTNQRVQANLYKAYLTVSQDKKVAEELKRIYTASANAYQKAWLLDALSKVNDSYVFISNELMHTTSPVIQTTAAEALVAINRSKTFSAGLKTTFAEIYKHAIAAGDPGVTGIVCAALANPELGYKTTIKNLDFLYEARKKMKLPVDIESLQPLEYAIAYLEGKPKPQPLKDGFNHAIDWKLVKSITKNQRVSVKTSKGEIIMLLFVDEAPGSVANFVSLVNRKYFDGKFFHRVVPNFVIQTGCRRGDGFGSEDYSIRSEFSTRRYTTGSVGMASAGKDTEGTQWFITHSSTPHLDGNYTIFAAVEKGIDVVNQIQVGDQIMSVSLVNN